MTRRTRYGSELVLTSALSLLACSPHGTSSEPSVVPPEAVAGSSASAGTGAAPAPQGGSGGSAPTTLDPGDVDPIDEPVAMPCEPAAANLTPAGPEAVLAPEYTAYYEAFLLGTVPGLPVTGHLGGCAISAADENTLLVVGESETPSSGLWSIGVVRDECGHIVAFDGQAQKIADAPYMDANLAYTDQGVLLYTQWPVNRLGQLLPGATQPSSEIDLAPLGVTGSPGGLAFVPSYLAAAGELRAAGWPGGGFFSLAYTVEAAPLLTFTEAELVTTVTEGGGFAYVPEGSPGFEVPSLIMAEWALGAVVTYAVDDQGNPLAETRKEFFTSFPAPWGAYFEPVTGDYLFLTWEAVPDRVYIVRGFEKPPPPPPPPVVK